ncbi:MAG: hypothetical protein K6G01_08995, partial [Eubacterium sp.]|nr:hypothetical protein [Eubacterium sp.]
IIFGLTGVSESATTQAAAIIDIVCMSVGFIVMVAYSFNYLNIAKRITPNLYRHRLGIRIILTLLIDVAIFFIFLSVTAALNIIILPILGIPI